MNSNGHIWEKASVSHPDWSGNAELDHRLTSAPLGEVVGLDEEAWMLIGFEISGGERSYSLRVIAVDRNDIVGDADVLPGVAEANEGEIPVTEFLVHDVDPFEILKAVTHGFDLKMRARGARDLPVRVLRQADIPAQPAG